MLLTDNQRPEDHLTVEPTLFRISLEKDKEALKKLIDQKPHIKIYDQLSTQLDDLIKSKHPRRKLSQEELEPLKAEHVGSLPMQDYGVWVYYPWSDKLVHILDEEEFIEVRTNRNVYKITREERDLLGRQKIGVVGLSVGQSAAVTMAMERGFGEIRLADFDLLELTNINRIRTGVQNLGLPKVVIVAREIKEIDPFLKVVCFGDGLTEENMDRFFCEGGNLDVIIDECDGLDIKILLRHKAKALRIPVVMDMNDRGTLDVERFDLEPDRPILHGMIDHLDHTKVKYMKTNEEKIPYMLAIIGVETLSNKLQASMCEVGQTITTWPQLASGVALGGALCADVSRRIILDQYHESGRYWVDMEELIGDKNPKKDNSLYAIKELKADELTIEEMKSAAEAIDIESLTLDKSQIEQLVAAAVIAPSAGNNQPWVWYSNEGKLYLFHNESESISWGDFDQITSNISFGAAIENLKLESGKLGFVVKSSLFPNKENARLIAAFSFTKTESPYRPELVSGMQTRLTNRKKGNGKKIQSNIINELQESITSIESASFLFTEDEGEMKKVADIVSAVERIRFLYPQGHHDFYTKELRWTEKDVLKTRTGLDVRSMELSETDKSGLIVAKNPEVIKLLNQWGGGAAFEKLSKGAITTSAGIGLITMPDYNPANFVIGGQAVQNLWLSANLNGLAFHPISAPLFLFARLNHADGEGLTASMSAELNTLQNELYEIFPILEERQGIFMFRLSYADEASVRSYRKPLEDVLTFN
ncbi:MAG: Rv1355c family protein [Pedobacter sp.]|nr:MAG: Rv1355c family protein [Pedobacter sp.]